MASLVRFCVALVFVSLLPTAFGQTTDAGIQPSLTSTHAYTVQASSNEAEAVSAVGFDESDFWESASCLPDGFISRSDMNIALNLCNDASKCTSVNDTDSGFAAATDGNLNTGANITTNGTVAVFEIALPTNSSIQGISFQLIGLEGTNVQLETRTNSSGPWETQLNLSNIIGVNGTLQRANTPNENATYVRIVSDGAFRVQELSVQGPVCFEQVTISFSNTISAWWFAANAFTQNFSLVASTEFLYSNGTTWTKIADLDPHVNGFAHFTTATAVDIRGLRVVHHLTPSASNVSVSITGLGGFAISPYSQSALSSSPADVSIRDFLGLNAIYQWGLNTFSDTHSSSQGPSIYLPLAAYFRDNHFWNFDVTDPDNSPDFQNMATNGTQARPDVNWDREYASWGLSSLYASIVFDATMFPPSVFDNVTTASFDYGKAFSEHFGANGTGAIRRVEVGSEPWDYDPSFYVQILEAMYNGLKADSTMEVYPCALQAFFAAPFANGHNNYATDHIPSSSTANNLAGMNVHVYPTRPRNNGDYAGVYPEHPQSSLFQIRNMMAWRNANAPGKPIWVSEFGYATTGPSGASCTFSECVDESAASIYTIRSVLIMMREGVDMASYFNYGNDNSFSGFKTKAGLTGAATNGYVRKAGFHGIEGLLETLGHDTFLSVLKEDSEAYIYLMGNATSRLPTHVVAWAPVPADNTTPVNVSIALSREALNSTSLTATGPVTAISPADVNGVWTFLLTGTPIVTRVGECGCLGLQCGRSNPCGGICTNCTECLCPRGSCGSSDLCEGDNVCDCNGFLCGAITACGETCEDCSTGCQCPTGNFCDTAEQVGVCRPCDCTGRFCGTTDACGNTCEDCDICICPAGQLCAENDVCIRAPECTGECLDDVCNPECGETTENCPRDCCPDATCGDGGCNTACGEDPDTCPVDCCDETICGDRDCQRMCGETELSCAEDCGLVSTVAYWLEITLLGGSKKRNVATTIEVLLEDFCRDKEDEFFPAEGHITVLREERGVFDLFVCAQCVPAFVVAVNIRDPYFNNTILGNARAQILLSGLNCTTGLDYLRTYANGGDVDKGQPDDDNFESSSSGLPPYASLYPFLPTFLFLSPSPSVESVFSNSYPVESGACATGLSTDICLMLALVVLTTIFNAFGPL